MTVATGITGKVVSWGGTANALIISKAGNGASMSITPGAASHDQTQYGASGTLATSARPGLKTWSAAISFKAAVNATGKLGHEGLVTFTSAYTTHVKEWTQNIRAGVLNQTTFDGAGKEWEDFGAGLLTIGGDYTGFAASAGGLVAPGKTPATAAFKVESGITLSGTAWVQQYGIDGNPADNVNVRGTYEFDGGVTAVGSNFLFASALVARPLASNLVFQTDSGNVLSGTAFWSSIALRNAVDGFISVDISVQGTGALGGLA